MGLSVGLLTACGQPVPVTPMASQPTPVLVRCPAGAPPSAFADPSRELTSELVLHDDFADAAASKLQASGSDSVTYALVDGAYLISVQQPSLFAWS
ncbi:MAG: hypothetical protein HC893_15390 [Chloroflexaceae bacterium]|nr:hypothetical protein [Chloroflexaceae bacterium]